jgi:PAS domain S-box-containing protein
MLSSGQPLKSVYRVIARDGHIVWFHCDAKLVRRKDGRPWFIHGVGVDITDLKQTEQALEEESAERERLQRLELERQIAKAEQSESRLAAIVESSEDAIVGKTLEGIITSWNAAATRIFGYRPQEIIGKSILTIIPPDRHAEEMEILRKIRAGERIEHFDTERITKSGQTISVSLTISPIKDSSGRVVGASKIARDITERKRMEHALRESEKYAAMGRVAAVLAHEINNPLEALTNTFYLLRRHPSLDESGQELAQIAELEIGRVSHIAKQTLGLYRQSARPIRVSLNRILSEILDVYARQFQNFGISVEKRFETEAQVMGFPVEIRQVFLNLIGNAIHAMPQGGRLRIKISGVANPRKAGPRRGVRISVIDTGVGIRREHRDRIFEPFFTTKSEKGTGLGLWVSRSIVQKLEGTIRARSCFLKGKATTCFSVFLPSVPSEEVQASVENAVHASL